MALLSILSLYNYDNTIFDKMALPVGIDKDLVVNNLLMELAEFEVIYTSPQMISFGIEYWSKKEVVVWQKLLDTTKFEYNPIFNYDRTEEWEDYEARKLERDAKETRDLTGSDSETRKLTSENTATKESTGKDLESRDITNTNNSTVDTTNNKLSESNTTGSTRNDGTDITKEYVSAFNATARTLKGETEQTLGSGNSVTGKVNNSEESSSEEITFNTNNEIGTINREKEDNETAIINAEDNETVQNSRTDRGTVANTGKDNETVSSTHKARMSGNIGVTTTQQMIEAEREVVKFNVVNYIIDSFKSRFCLLIY